MIRFPDQSFRTSGVSAVAQQVAGDPRLRVHEQLQATPGLADIANRAKELAFRSESCVRADQISTFIVRPTCASSRTLHHQETRRFGELARWAITTEQSFAAHTRTIDPPCPIYSASPTPRSAVSSHAMAPSSATAGHVGHRRVTAPVCARLAGLDFVPPATQIRRTVLTARHPHEYRPLNSRLDRPFNGDPPSARAGYGSNDGDMDVS
ncbi:hypothetical protein AB1N83_012545 [Pleurotus pulmonarius]